MSSIAYLGGCIALPIEPLFLITLSLELGFDFKSTKDVGDLDKLLVDVGLVNIEGVNFWAFGGQLGLKILAISKPPFLS